MLLCIYGLQAQVWPVVAVTGKHNCTIFLDPHVCCFIRSSAKLMEMVPSVGGRDLTNILVRRGDISSVILSHTKIYRTIICPTVLYGCETWSLILREERRLRVFENRVLRRIFGPKRDEVPREWRKIHNEELNDMYCSPNRVRVIKLRRTRWAGHVARMRERRGIHRVLVGKPEGKRPLGRPRRR